MFYQKQVTRDQDEGKDADADVETVFVQVEGAVRHEPADQPEDRRHVEHDQEEQDGVFESLKGRPVHVS